MTTSTGTRILSIDPTSRGFGFAIIEGGSRLIDWGVVHATTDKHRKSLDRVLKLIDQYRPRVLVMEDVRRGSRRGARARRLLSSIETLVERRGMKVKRVTQRKVREFFSSSGARSKHRTAELIAKRFPELAPRLPRPRKPWKSEAEMMAVFDAVAFASTLFDDHITRHLRTSER
ncbi:MAG: crossover junction endodeoxyribonuclease RuvC [Bryobacteraceae bacterium]|nr:crossover junction endodeoxyribonuclease RuvC [Bryobacteraceae bacterium]